MALTVIVTGYGRYNIFQVVRTEYTLQTQKDIQPEGYRVVLLSDLHYGVSMNDEQLQKVAEAIKENNIQILEDDTTVINDEVALIGRADRGDGNDSRQEISELTSKLDENKEWIVLDYQPSDYENVKKAGCDVVLSGHTHAGQIWPAGLFASVFYFDELNYGYSQQGNFNAVVTSGIAGWGYPIRTEKHSEYVVLNIVPEE